jgi:hypothetical protein
LIGGLLTGEFAQNYAGANSLLVCGPVTEVLSAQAVNIQYFDGGKDRKGKVL